MYHTLNNVCACMYICVCVTVWLIGQKASGFGSASVLYLSKQRNQSHDSVQKTYKGECLWTLLQTPVTPSVAYSSTASISPSYRIMMLQRYLCVILGVCEYII